MEVPRIKLSLYPDLGTHVSAVQAEVDMIPAERKAELAQLGVFIKARVNAGQPGVFTRDRRERLEAPVTAASSSDEGPRRT